MNKIMTVCGPIPPDKLGITLVHEHLLDDLSCWFREPEPSKIWIADHPVTMEVLGELRRDCFVSRDNLKLCDIDVAIEELMTFKKMGGGSLVEVTLPGLGRDPQALKKISESTRVNIVCGTGWYIEASHPPYVREKSIEDLTAIIIKELTEGINDTGVKAGVIGELGTSEPLTDNERKVLQAGARAQKETGVPLTFHPYPWGKEANTYLDVIEREEADMSKVYVSHMDFTGDLEYVISILERGLTVNYDAFGADGWTVDSLYPGAGGQSDSSRVAALVELIRLGYEKQLMLSHDVCMKMQLKRYGGYGYAHIQEHIVPALKFRGVTESQINGMLMENPRRILQYKTSTTEEC